MIKVNEPDYNQEQVESSVSYKKDVLSGKLTKPIRSLPSRSLIVNRKSKTMFFNMWKFSIFIVTLCGLLSPLYAITVQDCKCKYEKTVDSQQKEILRVPWLLSLGRPSGFDAFPSGSHFCTAVLINEQWALTSAQCVNSKATKSVRIGLGSSDTGEMYHNGRLEIESILIHPAHQLNKLAGNLALLKLAQPIEFNETVQPACLDAGSFPTQYDQLYETDDFFMIGWGVDLNPEDHLTKKVDQYPSEETFKQTLKPGHICERSRALICAHPNATSTSSIRQSFEKELFGYYGSPVMMNKKGKFYNTKIKNMI